MITVGFLASAFVDYDPDLVDELMHYALMSADGLKAAMALAPSEPHTPTLEGEPSAGGSTSTDLR